MDGIYLEKLTDKYNKYVIKKKGCWDWSGHKVNGGYGCIRIGYPKIYAHRVSWIIYNEKEIPTGMCVLHKCDNPSCTNPEHLFLGTPKDNILDAIKKGRHPTIGKSGINNHMAKLNPDKVNIIRSMIESGIKHMDISKVFNISKSHVSTIGKRACWRAL